MLLRKMFLYPSAGICWAACVLALWAGGVGAAARATGDRRMRFNVATPHTPVNTYKYIPLGYSSGSVDLDDLSQSSPDVESSRPGLAPSELILTALRTALDVVRGINAKRQASRAQPQKTTARNDTALTVPRSKSRHKSRGFEDYYDEHDHDTTTTTTTPKPVKQSRYTDPWAGYYDFIINEGSFKFWSVFQLFTAALLLYACLSAIYYAKFNPIIPDYDREYDDYFLERSVGRHARSLDASQLASGLKWINPRTFQFILDAISKNYET